MNRLTIIDVKSEIGAGTRGAGLGPDALRVAAHNAGSSFFGKWPSVEIPHLNNLLLEPVRTQWAKRINGLTQLYRDIADQVCAELMDGNFPIVLAGDHSTAGGTMAGIKKAFPHEPLGVVWIDAHADLHSPFTTPSGNLHGMPLGVAIGDDHRSVQRNALSAETVQLWENLKNVQPGPWLHPEHLVYVGLRDFEPEEGQFIRQKGIEVQRVEAVRQRGTGEAVSAILDYLSECPNIYVSFDVDSMDPELVSDGTGTPAPGGFSEEEAAVLISGLMRSGKVVCLEIVEINPTLDHRANRMAEAAFSILEKATAMLPVQTSITNSR